MQTVDVVLRQNTGIWYCDKTHLKCERSTVQCLLLPTSNEVNANTKLYMQIWSRNLTTLLSLLVKRTSNSCGVVGRLGNRTLPFSQHKENYGLLLLDFANRSLIHIFMLQNPQIVSISPQSHRAKANASLSLNNCNASLPREGYAHAVACWTVCCSQCRWLPWSCGILDGPANSKCCLACRSLCRQLWHSRADSDVFRLNSAKALIPGTRFSRKSVCSSFY